MNLSHLTDDELELSLGKHVRIERESLTAILYHLLEVNRRRLYSKHRCESLNQYACKFYGYSEDEAQFRITAMYLLKDVPEVALKIEAQSISLTNLVKAQVHFRKEAKENVKRTSQEKLELLTQLEGCSKAEAQQVIADSAETLFRVSGVQVPLARNEEIPFRPSSGLKAKLKRLKEVIGVVSIEELVEKLADLGLKTWDPLEKAKRKVARRAKSEAKIGLKNAPTTINQDLENSPSHVLEISQGKVLNNLKDEKVISEVLEVPEQPISVPERNAQLPRTRSIKMTVQHEVQLRDGGACSNCGSRMKLQLDHIQDFARGGVNEAQNLRLLCRPCNQRHAIDSYGMKKMGQYLKSRDLDRH